VGVARRLSGRKWQSRGFRAGSTFSESRYAGYAELRAASSATPITIVVHVHKQLSGYLALKNTDILCAKTKKFFVFVQMHGGTIFNSERIKD
jgi:hypothetical protein